jgi:drug/metabolite transporter (DMT)-like permease
VSRHSLGSLFVAGCALSWGFIGIIVRELDVPALTLVCFRVMLSGASVALVTAFVFRRRELLRFPGRNTLWLGAALALHWGLYFTAIKQTSVASAVLITYAAPIFMAMIAPRMIGERVPAVSIAALAVSMVGIALISLAGGSGEEAVRPLGVALALGAAVTYALVVVGIRRWAADVDPTTFVIWQELTASVVLFPSLFFADYGKLSGGDIGQIVVLGVVLTGFTGVLYVTALKYVPVTTVGILAYMEPVSAALLAALLLGESLTFAVVVGGLAIVVAGVVVALKGPQMAVSIEEPGAATVAAIPR